MFKKVSLCLALLLLACLYGCEPPAKPKLGISFGVGAAKRFPLEMAYMKERAAELGMEVEGRLNKDEMPPQRQDCLEMINSGISVLIITPRDGKKAEKIVADAKKKGVKVLSYCRPILGENIDLFIGYDMYNIGSSLARHLSEKVYKGSVAILKGDENDFNSAMLHEGAMQQLRPLVEKGELNIFFDKYVRGWSPVLAKAMLTEAILKNGGKVDAVFAQNDVLAGVAAEVVKELNIPNKVVIVGMDGELAALRRLAEGTQDATVLMDLKDMARTAVNEAYNMAAKRKPNVNSDFDNKSNFKIDAYLINGKMVTRENLDALVIAPGLYTREEIYGK